MLGSSSCSMIVMRSNAVERFKCFPDSGLSSLIESYWVVMVISSPTLFPTQATTFTDDTFGPREPMVPLHSRFRCSMYKSHGMFFSRTTMHIYSSLPDQLLLHPLCKNEIMLKEQDEGFNGIVCPIGGLKNQEEHSPATYNSLPIPLLD